MKLSDLKKVCDEGMKNHFMDEFHETFNPSRVKVMLELLEEARTILDKVRIETYELPGDSLSEKWLEKYKKEMGE
jgi:hypothetical protein